MSAHVGPKRTFVKGRASPVSTHSGSSAAEDMVGVWRLWPDESAQCQVEICPIRLRPDILDPQARDRGAEQVRRPKLRSERLCAPKMLPLTHITVE